MAAPSQYRQEYHDDWSWSLALKGATDQEVAESFGVSKRTIIRWKADHPSFAEAYQRGKDVADAKVERALYQRAIGYKVTETEKIIEMDPKTGDTKPVRVKTSEKEYPPDTMAGMYWLNNRSKGKWSQRQEVTLGGTVKMSPMENLTEEELRNLARMDEEQNGE